MMMSLFLLCLTGARLYVPNQSSASVSVLDVATGRVVTTVDLPKAGFTANAKPHHVVVEPDGSFWYVSLIGDNVVVKFDRENKVVGAARTETPGMLALDPKRDRLYATRSMTAVQAPSSVAVIRRSDMRLIDDLDVIVSRPHAIALDPRGYVHVGGLGNNQIATIDASSDQVSVTDIGGPPHAYAQFAVSPDGRYLVATGHLTAKLVVFDVQQPLDPRLVTSVPIEPAPYDVAFAPDGRSVWIANQRGNAATQVDAGTWRVAGVVRGRGFAEPHGVAVARDGKTVFISNHGQSARPADTTMAGMHADHAPRATGTIVIIDALTRTVRQVVEVGQYAAGLGL